MRRTVPLLITALGGLVLVVAYFLPHTQSWGEWAAIWFDILAAIGGEEEPTVVEATAAETTVGESVSGAEEPEMSTPEDGLSALLGEGPQAEGE